MLDTKEVFIFGYSGHAYVIIESLFDSGYTIAGYFDFEKADKNPYNLSYLGNEQHEAVTDIVKDKFVFPTLGDNKIRQKLVSFFESKGLRQMKIIDPKAAVSNSAQIGNSTYIGKHACINACAEVGIGAIINTNAIVEHECTIGNFSHVAPSATLCGNVRIGNACFIGANTVIRQNLSVVDNVTIGAGGVVVKNIENPGIWIGNPVKLTKL